MKKQLIKELIKGENSGFVKDFDKAVFLKRLHKKYNSRFNNSSK